MSEEGSQKWNNQFKWNWACVTFKLIFNKLCDYSYELTRPGGPESKSWPVTISIIGPNRKSLSRLIWQSSIIRKRKWCWQLERSSELDLAHSSVFASSDGSQQWQQSKLWNHFTPNFGCSSAKCKWTLLHISLIVESFWKCMDQNLCLNPFDKIRPRLGIDINIIPQQNLKCWLQYKYSISKRIFTRV